MAVTIKINPCPDSRYSLAASFVAANSQYLSSSNSIFRVGNENFSFGGWVKFNDVATPSYFMSVWDSDVVPLIDERSIMTRITSGTVRFFLSSDGTAATNVELATTFTPTQNVWCFLVFVYDADADLMKVSMDGATFQTQSNANGAFSSTTADFSINALNTGTAPIYSDTETDQCFFLKGTALTQAQVTTAYNSGNGLDYNGWIAAGLPSPTAYYTMQSGATRFTDVTGNGYDLTNNNNVGIALGKV